MEIVGGEVGVGAEERLLHLRGRLHGGKDRVDDLGGGERSSEGIVDHALEAAVEGGRQHEGDVGGLGRRGGNGDGERLDLPSPGVDDMDGKGPRLVAEDVEEEGGLLPLVEEAGRIVPRRGLAPGLEDDGRGGGEVVLGRRHVVELVDGGVGGRHLEAIPSAELGLREDGEGVAVPFGVGTRELLPLPGDVREEAVGEVDEELPVGGVGLHPEADRRRMAVAEGK